eukprot:scaffold44171_cov64-Attheya_sp.AAC.1
MAGKSEMPAEAGNKRKAPGDSSTLSERVESVEDSVETEADEDSSSHPADDENELIAPRKALFSAVEGGSDGKEEILSCRPVVKLFFYPENGTLVEKETLATSEQRAMLLNSIRSRKFQKSHAHRLFAGILPILKDIITNEYYVPASAYESEEESADGKDEHNKDEIVPDEASTEAMLFMRASALMVEAHLDCLMERRSASANASEKLFKVTDEAFSVAELLHDVLFSLQSCGPEGMQLQSYISSLCEKWWLNRFIDRDYMVVQLIPLLMVKSLDDSAQKQTVKRLLTLKEAFNLFDFEEEETIAYLRSLILRTVSSPLYLGCNEGVRLIAYLFQVHDSLTRDLHSAIKVQIPDAKKKVLEAYGDIYLRSWTASPDGSAARMAVEELALQDLMFAALHIGAPKMSRSIRTVLSPLHEAKKTPSVDKMLHRMYGPILWRSLSAANPLVRINASIILSETFPLRDPDAGHIQTEACVEKSIGALKSLLTDSDPRVRVAGSDASARIIATFWDALPTKDIRSILNRKYNQNGLLIVPQISICSVLNQNFLVLSNRKILDIISKHASDLSSSAVRAAAITAVTCLLDAPQSHAVLRALLPSLGNLIHDNVERVRLAVVRMLIKIKSIRGVKYYHIVPVDHLLARLAAEEFGSTLSKGSVASALTELLLNSYFPRGDHVSSTDQVKRTLSFLTTHPQAASVFYSNISMHLGVNSVSKLAAMLMRCLTAAVDDEKSCQKEKKSKRKRSTENQQKTLDLEGKLSASNTQLMAAIAETICSLWESIATSLTEAKYQECSDFLSNAFSGTVLTDALEHFEEKASLDDWNVTSDCRRTCAALLQCAGRLPPQSVRGMSQFISSKLNDIPNSDDGRAAGVKATSHIALLCLWGMTEDVAISLSDSISSAFEADSHHEIGGEEKSKDGRRSSRLVKSLSLPQVPGKVAIQIIANILSGPDPSCISARKALLTSPTAYGSIEKALVRATFQAEKMLDINQRYQVSMDEADVSMVLSACESYGRLALHKGATTGGNGQLQFNPQARTLLAWITEKVLPSFAAPPPIPHTPAVGPLDTSILNLSRISSAGSVNASPMTQFSSSLAHSHNKANQNKTPEHVDTSFNSADGDISFELEGDNSTSRITAVSLVSSATVVFAEWLAVGGEGAAEIGATAGLWCQALQCEDSIFAKKLYPAFCRLALQLVYNANDFSVLKQLLTFANDNSVGSQEELVMRKTFDSILSSRGNNHKERVERMVDTVLVAVEQTLEIPNKKDCEINELPLSVDDVCSDCGKTISIALSAIVSSPLAMTVLARDLVKFLDKPYESKDKPHRFFVVKCLWYLITHAPKGAKGSEIHQLVRHLDINSCDSGGKLMEFAGDMSVHKVS